MMQVKIDDIKNLPAFLSRRQISTQSRKVQGGRAEGKYENEGKGV